jgi:NAD(P)-dependent dehydrogenase (short-subunit alcohol dehydrogenase family)
MSSVVITGSSKGVGFALAKAFRAQGFDVVVSGSSPATTEEAVTALSAESGTGRVVGQAAAVTDPAQLQALWDRAVAEFGRVDIWINNAGLAKTTVDFADLPIADAHAMVTTNMLGTMYGCQVALRGLTAQGGGKLFNILGGGSDGSTRPRMAVYGATKRGLNYLTKSLVKEHKDSPVIIGEVRPGILLTEGWRREAAELPGGIPPKERRALNVLADKPDTAAPWLVDQMIATTKSGTAIAWLSGGKIASRFATAGFKKRDLLGEFGL